MRPVFQMVIIALGPEWWVGLCQKTSQGSSSTWEDPLPLGFAKYLIESQSISLQIINMKISPLKY